MNRKTVLAGVGTVVGLSVGHTVIGADSTQVPTSELETDRDDDKSSDDGPSNEQTERSGQREDVDFDPDSTYDTIEYGDPDADDSRPRRIALWNDASVERQVAVEVRTETGDSVLEERRVVPAEQTLEIVLHEPGDYAVILRAPDDAATTVPVESEQFDCNATTTSVRLTPNATFESETVTTWLECGSTVTPPEDEGE